MGSLKLAPAFLLILASLSINSVFGIENVFHETDAFKFIRDDVSGEMHMITKSDNTKEKSFRINLGAGLDGKTRDKVSWPKTTKSGGVQLDFGKDYKLEIEHPYPECSRFTWTTAAFSEVRDCIDYGTASWFGGPEQYEQLWPVQKLNRTNYALVTKYEDDTGTQNMGLAERYWLSSEGVYLFVDHSIPLFIDSNNFEHPNQLCFISRDQPPYYDTVDLVLRYTVCSFPNVRTAQGHAIGTILNYPSAVPDELMFRQPIWSTWARYKTAINQSLVIEFAQEILDNGFANSQIEIDDDWETCYGELEFNPLKFPDPKGMVETLHQMGFRVTLWVHPFINRNCTLFDEYLSKGYFVKDLQGNVKTRWWNGDDAAAVDILNPDAKEDYSRRLVQLRQATLLDGYKFDAGESAYLPQVPDIPVAHPSEYTTAYLSLITTIMAKIGTALEVRSGYNSQREPLFMRMIDKDTRWGINNGLKSVVTTLLQMNIVGYPMVLADMIGGNGYGEDEITPELFIRWLQASTFMPALQFSYVPWQFNDPSVVEISKKFVELHYQYSDYILGAAATASQGGLPINTPICFSVPSSDFVDMSDACAVDDEFLLGAEYLIAPVMEEGAVTRDIYLPEGTWKDMNTGLYQNGPVLILNYPAPLDTLPYFHRENIVNASSNLLPSIFASIVFVIGAILLK